MGLFVPTNHFLYYSYFSLFSHSSFNASGSSSSLRKPPPPHSFPTPLYLLLFLLLLLLPSFFSPTSALPPPFFLSVPYHRPAFTAPALPLFPTLFTPLLPPFLPLLPIVLLFHFLLSLFVVQDSPDILTGPSSSAHSRQSDLI